MSRSLKELLCYDLNQLINREEGFVASEESIQLLLHLNKKRLSNISFVHIDQLRKYLTDHPLDEIGHYQYFIESGVRDLSNQRTKGSIHYSALDLFVTKVETRDGPIKCRIGFLADHHHGHKLDWFTTIVTEFKIQLFIVGCRGSKKYQADSFHCPFFTLRHLLLTSKDSELRFLLERELALKKLIPTDFENGHAYLLYWDQLHPKYIRGAQSFEIISDYVDADPIRLALREVLPFGESVVKLTNLILEYSYPGDDEDSIRSALREMLPFGESGVKLTNLILEYSYPGDDIRGLRSYKLDERLSPYLIPELACERSSPNYLKIRNKFIDFKTAKLASLARNDLLNSGITEIELIDICYKIERYPKVRQLLYFALSEGNTSRIYSFFEFTFYYAHALERCDPTISSLLKDASVLKFIINGKFDLMRLLKHISRPISGTPHLIEEESENCKNVSKKIAAIRELELFDTIIKMSRSPHPSIDLMGILCSIALQFCKDKQLIEAYLTGKISLSIAEKITKKELAAENLPIDKVNFFIKKFNTVSPHPTRDAREEKKEESKDNGKGGAAEKTGKDDDNIGLSSMFS